MEIKKLTFITDLQPTHLTLHSLFSTLCDKKHENKEGLQYKIWYEDKKIILIHINLDLLEIEKISFFDKIKEKSIRIKKLDEQVIEAPKFKANDCIELSGNINYAIHSVKNGKSTNYCPITNKGTFKPESRQTALNYLSKKTGINLLDTKFERTHRFERFYFPENNGNDKNKGDDFHFRNLFSFKISGFIQDEQTTNSLYFSSIGRKRSYGLGNVYAHPLNTSERENEHQTI